MSFLNYNKCQLSSFNQRNVVFLFNSFRFFSVRIINITITKPFYLVIISLKNSELHYQRKFFGHPKNILSYFNEALFQQKCKAVSVYLSVLVVAAGLVLVVLYAPRSGHHR